MAIVNLKLIFEVFFELIDHHISWSSLHFLEDFIHIIVMFRLLCIVCVVMSVVKKD